VIFGNSLDEYIIIELNSATKVLKSLTMQTKFRIRFAKKAINSTISLFNAIDFIINLRFLSFA
jgi:hypothetical protein